MQQPSGTTGSGVISSRHTGTSTVPLSPNDQSLSSNVNENGNVFTLTNIYTFGVNGNLNTNPSTDKYRIKSFVEVFDQPSSQQETEYERHYHEKHSSSSSSITRKIQTNFNDKHHYELSGSYFYVI
jgi:hypothetical protein